MLQFGSFEEYKIIAWVSLLLDLFGPGKVAHNWVQKIVPIVPAHFAKIFFITDESRKGVV